MFNNEYYIDDNYNGHSNHSNIYNDKNIKNNSHSCIYNIPNNIYHQTNKYNYSNNYNDDYNYNYDYNYEDKFMYDDIDYDFLVTKINEKQIIQNMPAHIQCKICKDFIIKNSFHICEKHICEKIKNIKTKKLKIV